MGIHSGISEDSRWQAVAHGVQSMGALVLPGDAVPVKDSDEGHEKYFSRKYAEW